MSKSPPKEINVTALRANLYKLLDEVVETGKPLIIDRKGQKLKISLDDQPSRLQRLLSMPSPGESSDTDLSDDELIYHGMGEYKIDSALAESYKLDE